MVDLTLDPERYVSERFEQYRAWYDKKAVQAKSWYLRMRAFSVVAGGAVPVLVNMEVPYTVFGYPAMRAFVTVVSLLVVIVVSLESVFHYREQWKNYRSTEQLLMHELFWFRARVGKYGGLEDREAFLLFVERVEDAIAAENSATLNVMTMAAEASDDSKRRPRGDEDR